MGEPQRALDTYKPDEMAIPEWRVVQKVGAGLARDQGAEEGQFYNTLTGDIVDELNIVVVDILSGRARWGAEITSSGPLCFSLDARSNKSAGGEDCSQCKHRLDTPWSVDAGERRKMCCLNYTILGIDLDHDNMPIILRTHGVSALPARQLITQLRMNRSLKGEYHKAVINIQSQEKNTPYGPTYVMRPKLLRLIDDEVVAEELKIESKRLLGTPIPLPEARPEEEGEEELQPLGFTPQGTPFYSEEEKEKLLREEAEPAPQETRKVEEASPLTEAAGKVEETAQPVEAAQTEEKVEEPASEEKVGEQGKETEGIDLNF